MAMDAARPEAKANASEPCSSAHMALSKASRLGQESREYICEAGSPFAARLNIVDSTSGGDTGDSGKPLPRCA